VVGEAKDDFFRLLTQDCEASLHSAPRVAIISLAFQQFKTSTLWLKRKIVSMDTITTGPEGSNEDRFFTNEQRQRLEDLMGMWRAARDASSQLPPEQQAELESLVEAQLEGAARRAEAMLADIQT
jgi:hypothetical protein